MRKTTTKMDIMSMQMKKMLHQKGMITSSSQSVEKDHTTSEWRDE